MNKKRVAIFAGLFASIVLVSFLVSADPVQDFGNIWNTIIGILDKIASTILGSSAIDGMAAGEVLFIKVLFFIIVLAVVWSVLDLIPPFSENTWVVVLVSIAVSVLSTRFLATPGWVKTVLLPYSTLGIALTSFLPLLVYFYFIEKALGTHQTLRKVAWILAGVVFFGLFISRYSEISQVTSGKFNPLWIYLITAGICLILFIFDKTIRRAFVDAEMKSLGAADRNVLIAELRRKITQANKDLTEGIISSKEHDKMIKEFRKRLIAVESY